MKLANFFLMTVLVGTLGVLGCNDDTGTGGSGGTAGTGGSGTGTDFCTEDCDDTRPEAITDCEDAYNACVADQGDQCVTKALFTCQLV
jgi:hypothetical protein